MKTVEEWGFEISNLKAELLTAEQKLQALQEGRAQVVLQGTIADIEKRDSQIRRLALESEQIRAKIRVAVSASEACENDERAAAAKRLATDAISAVAGFKNFWLTEYPDLARKIADGLALEQRAVTARKLAVDARKSVAENEDGMACREIPELPSIPMAYFNVQVMGHPSRAIVLPNVEPGPPFAHPQIDRS